METSQTENKPNSELSHKLFIRDKTGVYVLQPFKDMDNKQLQIDSASITIVSNNFLGAVSGGIVYLYDINTLELVKKLDEYELVTNAHFSPGHNLLVIIQKPTVNNNLKVIDLQTFKIKFAFHSTTHPSAQWPQIGFSSDEKFIFKLIKGNLDIYNLGSETIYENYGKITGVINYDISEISIEQLTETAVICGRVVIDEKSKKKKSLVTVFKLSDLSKPIKEMSISICDRMKIKVSPDKKSVLFQSFCDDTSSTSYYGESSLYYLDLLYGKFQKIPHAEGPIHDFEWTPNGANYVVCAGHQPSKTHLYNNTGKFVKEICVSKVNTIKISPDSRLLCLAGFGNLHGEIEIYRLSDFTIIGKSKFYCGITLNWSQDSRFLLGAVLSPRVRVDNEYKIFTYNGEDLLGEKFKGEIYECEWIPSKDLPINDFELKVSEVYLKKLQEEKEKNKKNANSLSNKMNTLSLSMNPGTSKGGIPGLKKK